MFSWFKKKSNQEKLEAEYKKLMGEWHKLSSLDRAESDKKYAEAQRVLEKINKL